MYNTMLRGHRSTLDTHIMKVDLVENVDNFVVFVNVPAVSRDNLSVTFQNKQLTIDAEYTKLRGSVRTHFRERTYGKVSRVVQIHGDIAVEDIACKLQDGLLTITLPKDKNATNAQPLKIPIE